MMAYCISIFIGICYTSMEELNGNSFNDFIKRNRIAVVDFWATWCKPCFTIEKILEELEKEMEGIAFGKLNTDENLDIARSYNVLSLPTIIIFFNGEPAKRIIGSRTKEDIRYEIEEVHRSSFF